MNTIQHFTQRAVATLFALGVAATGMAQAQAQVQAQTATTTAGAPAQGRHASAATHEERQARFAEHFAKRQQALHDALKLSSAQEGVWTTFVNATRPQAHGARPDRAAWASLPAPQRLEQSIARHKQRTAAMETRLAALNSLYAVLTPEQKKVFDQQFHQGHGGRHRGHHGHGKHGQSGTQQG